MDTLEEETFMSDIDSEDEVSNSLQLTFNNLASNFESNVSLGAEITEDWQLPFEIIQHENVPKAECSTEQEILLLQNTLNIHERRAKTQTNILKHYLSMQNTEITYLVNQRARDCVTISNLQQQNNLLFACVKSLQAQHPSQEQGGQEDERAEDLPQPPQQDRSPNGEGDPELLHLIYTTRLLGHAKPNLSPHKE